MVKAREIKEGIYWMGAVDWDRRLFDALIPLPDGTSYNAYYVEGRDKTALLDAVDPPMESVLERQLKGVTRLDYLVAHHAEQDHAGTLHRVLEWFPEAQLVASPRGKELLLDLLPLPAHRVGTVADGETLDLGGRTLEAIYTPWVHWPETISTYLPEDRILFSCDFFGSHLATSQLYADEGEVYLPAKRYYAEIMMPFRSVIAKNLERVEQLEIDLIAPSHGPLHSHPRFIMDAYRDWVGNPPGNIAVVPYVSMHDSTRLMVEHLVAALNGHGVRVEQYDLTSTDVGKLAMSLVDASTLILGTPAVLAGAHPHAVFAAYLANILRPKLRQVSLIGSYGWGARIQEQLSGLMGNLKVEMLDPVLIKGLPRDSDYDELDRLASEVAQRHRQAGVL